MLFSIINWESMDMLNKIENISPNSSYKEKSNYIGNLKDANQSVHLNSVIADSFTFSAAVKYLNQLKWKLKQFKHTANGQVEVEFSIDDFSFHTTLFGPDFYSHSVEYRISNDHALESSNIIYDVDLKFEFYTNSLLDPVKIADINYLGSLFERIVNSGSTNSLKLLELMKSSQLLDGISSGLVKELSDIHKKLLLFLEKVTGDAQFPPLNSTLMLENKDLLQINIIAIEIR